MSGMQRQDYERISKSIRMVRRQTLEALDEDDPSRAVLRHAYGELALQLARAMWAVNKRFRYDSFIKDCLGNQDGPRVVRTFTETTEDLQ